jgi:aspartate-semialdehyde dehydrogenase
MYSIAVVGATGLVGGEILNLLREREFPLGELRCYASERSVGGGAGEREAPVDLLDRADFDGIDIAFFAATEAVSAEWVGRATDAGAVVIDLSQLYANDPDVPLVIPEINAEAIADYHARRIIACPIADVVQLAVILRPLADAAGLTRVIVSSYQPVSEAGRAGVADLSEQTLALMRGEEAEVQRLHRRIAFNVLPQVGDFLEGGGTRNEEQIVVQTRRVLGRPDLAIAATSVRVPLFYGLSQSVNVETQQPLSADEARELLRGAPGVWLHDDPGANDYPTPMDAVGNEATLVGRIRADDSVEHGLILWISADNVRKGAALHAVGIAEILVREYLG